MTTTTEQTSHARLERLTGGISVIGLIPMGFALFKIATTSHPSKEPAFIGAFAVSFAIMSLSALMTGWFKSSLFDAALANYMLMCGALWTLSTTHAPQWLVGIGLAEAILLIVIAAPLLILLVRRTTDERQILIVRRATTVAFVVVMFASFACMLVQRFGSTKIAAGWLAVAGAVSWTAAAVALRRKI